MESTTPLSMDVDQDGQLQNSSGPKLAAPPVLRENSVRQTPPSGNNKNKRPASSPLMEDTRQKRRVDQDKESEGWQEQKNGRRKLQKPPKESKDRRRRKKARARNNAVKVTAETDVSYADIIKQLNKNEQLKNGNAVETIRRT